MSVDNVRVTNEIRTKESTTGFLVRELELLETHKLYDGTLITNF